MKHIFNNNFYNVLIILVIILVIIALYVYVSNNLNKLSERLLNRSNKQNNIENFQNENIENSFFKVLDSNLKNIVDLENVSNPINSNIIGIDGGEPIPKLDISVTGSGQPCLKWKTLHNPAYQNMKGKSCSQNWNENGQPSKHYRCLADRVSISKGQLTHQSRTKRCSPLIGKIRELEGQNFVDTRRELRNALRSKIANMNAKRDEENKYLDEIIQNYKNRKDKIAFLSYFIDRNKQIMSNNDNRISQQKKKFSKMDKDHNIDISKYNKANRQTREKQKQITYLTKYFKIASGIFIIAIILNIWVSMKKKIKF